EGLSRLWGGATVGTLAMLSASPLDDLETATKVVSATPFVSGRHYRKRDGEFGAWLVKEVCRSCQEMGLPAPVSVERLESLELKNQAAIHWANFVRQRKNGLPSKGYGFRLVFDKPVHTPFALGKLAHFGLGLFTASQD
ncbi:MAG: hypothetical protein K6E40_17475, partial [Desulfovibrio sp.]|nr:hypothetical protein [Desulfovibrio sp.]